MAKVMLGDGFEKYLNELDHLYNDASKISKKVVASGAGIVADEVRSSLNSLPTDSFRYLDDGEKFNGVPVRQKNDLLDSLGITSMKISNSGNANVKVGFSGYGTLKTKKYPNGVPNALLARSIESGSSVRKKTPFMRQAVNRSSERAKAEMGKTLIAEMSIYAL